MYSIKDISKLAVELDFKLNKELLPKLIKAQQKTGEKLKNDVINSAPGNGEYISSIKLGETTNEKGIIKTEVYSDLKVGGNDPKWSNVLLANFINWGTGPLGKSTNNFPHKYPYTTDKPWNYIAQMQYETTGTWGMAANPHFYKSLQKNVSSYYENIREAFK